MAIFISAVDPRVLDDQKDAFRAAKEVGVQRVIPCDFATPTEKGVRELGDTVRFPHVCVAFPCAQIRFV